MVGADNYFRWNIDLKEEIPYKCGPKDIDLIKSYADKLIEQLDANGDMEKLINLLKGRYPEKKE